jgi:ABC-type sugar transport system ATPase subunit
MTLLKFSDVAKSFSGIPVLKAINLTIEPGEVV